MTFNHLSDIDFQDFMNLYKNVIDLLSHQIILYVLDATLQLNTSHGCCVCFCFLCLWPLSLGVTSPEKLFCSLCKTILNIRYLIIILQISLEKGECFDFNHALGCIYPTLNTIRLLGQVYHFSLLICYPCSFYFHALMLVALWE